jgi:ABC-type branched-subunit amino acid transport system substrate-binding protein
LDIYIIFIIGTYVMKIYQDLVIICYDNTIINHPMNQTFGDKNASSPSQIGVDMGRPYCQGWIMGRHGD